MNNTNTAIKIGLSTLFLLLIPFVAMQFTTEVNWNLSDFLVAGVMLFGVSTAFTLAVSNLNSRTFKVAAGLTIIIAFALIWAEMAVGIFNSPIAGS